MAMDDYQPPSFFIGHHDHQRPLPVTSSALDDAHAANYDMLTTPITTPHFHSRVLALLSSSLSEPAASSSADVTLTHNASPVVVDPLTPVDTPLAPEDTTSQLIAVTSSWIDLSSPDPIIADVSSQVLKLELSHAAFCGITYVLIPGPRIHGRSEHDGGVLQYARAILDGLSQGPYMQLYIWLPMTDHSDDDREGMGDLAPFVRERFRKQGDSSRRLDLFGTWEVWDMNRSICKYASRLFAALSIPKLLPPVPIQSRWYSEPVRLLTLEADVFSKNAKGYPVLSKPHQALIMRFMRLRNPPWFILCNVGTIPASTKGGQNGIALTPSAFPSLSETKGVNTWKDPTAHLSYMRNLQSRQPILNAIERFGSGYQDFLQAPLQPLTVNLESVTYEVFERDPVKYAWYERAIASALSDWQAQRKPSSNPDGRIVVAVVGAGRGPLVTRALNASESTGVPIDLWALEKNPSAYVLLQRHNATIWGGRVHLVKSDMRTWRGPFTQANAQRLSQMSTAQIAQNSVSPSATFTGSPATDSTYLLATAPRTPEHYKIDVLISELLGSFGDNELSPECLDGVQHLMNPVHGISIPHNYTAFIAPIAAPKLHADISNTMTPTNATAAELPYVVMLNAIDHIATIERQQQSVADLNGELSPLKNQPPTPPSSNPSASNSKTPQRQPSASTIPPSPTAVIFPTWSFTHPNPLLPPPSSSPSNAHNARYCHLTFHIPNRATCHGLAGYFESLLYPSINNKDSVELSTNPLTMPSKSPDMISWFPIYFPLKTPLYVPDGAELGVSMWRKTDERKVWYEWKVEVHAYIQGDARGKAIAKRVRIGGSELHSSEKEACLM